MKNKAWMMLVLLLFIFWGSGCSILQDDYDIVIDGDSVKFVVDNSASKYEKIEIAKVDIEEQTLYEGNDVLIKVTGAEKTTDGVNIKLYIENNGSLSLSFNAHSYAANHIMTRNNIWANYSMDCDVAPGKKANSYFTIKNEVLYEFGIKELKNVDVLLWAYDNDKHYKSFETDVLHIHTSLEDYVNSVITGETCYDSDVITVDYFKSDGDEYSFIISNKTADYIDFDVVDISINDYTITETDYSLSDEQVLDGCQYVFTIKIDSDFKSTNGINNVEKIEFAVKYRPHGIYQQEQKTDMIFKNF